jgi:hypothetical protein
MRDGEMSVKSMTATLEAAGGTLPERSARAIRMNETLRVTWLRVFLRVVAVGYLAANIPWITLILLHAPILAPDSRFAPLLRFQPYNAHYESMLVAIHVVWALMLWRASHNPAQHPLFIDFTIWTHAAHGLVMVVATPIQKGPVMMLIEAFPLLAIAVVLWWLWRSISPPAIVLHQEGHGPISGAPVSDGFGSKGGAHETILG